MFYVQAADGDLRAKGECGGAVTATLKYLLERKIVDAALAMHRGTDHYDGIPALITDPSKITELSGALHCAPIMQSTVLFNTSTVLRIRKWRLSALAVIVGLYKNSVKKVP